jgi:hypothetical protein
MRQKRTPLLPARLLRSWEKRVWHCLAGGDHASGVLTQPQRKGSDMTNARCTCGFTEAGDETITDHLLAVFTPDACRGSDGLLHEEAFPPLTCLCGFTAATAQELDEHFLAMFTPDNSTDPNGVSHKAVA